MARKQLFYRSFLKATQSLLGTVLRHREDPDHRQSSIKEVLLLTLTLLADLYVPDIEMDKHTVLLVLCRLIMVVAKRAVQPQSEPVPLPAAEDGACTISPTHQGR